MEQSSDFVEFLGLAGLGQAEVRSIRRVDVILEGGARLQDITISQGGRCTPCHDRGWSKQLLFIKFAETGKLPERSERREF